MTTAPVRDGALSVQVTFDAHEPARLAGFWAVALGYIIQPPPPGYDSWEAFGRAMGIPEENWGDYSAAIDPAGAGPRLFFQKVPEGKTAKNRVHLDVNVGLTVDDPAARPEAVQAHVAKLVAAGAKLVEEREHLGHSFTVMTDPEGNEFCVQ